MVERGPWWGGAWERLVGVVKGLLRHSLGQAVLSWEELVTPLTEVKKVINCWPISYVWESSEPGGGISIPLCPEQFLLQPQADGKEEERELNVSKEIQRRKKWLSSMNDLWKREYLHQVLGSQGKVWSTRPNLYWRLMTERNVLIGGWVLFKNSLLVVMEDAERLLFK